MKNKPMFEWDEELGLASCIITDGENTFYGQAHCHDDDLDMMNEKTGCEIAFKRAKIDCLRFKRDCELKPMLKALKQAYYSMNQSKQFNPKSYENKMLQRQIRQIEFDLDTIRDMLNTEEQNLREYIQEKDKFYKRIRHNREKAKNN